MNEHSSKESSALSMKPKRFRGLVIRKIYVNAQLKGAPIPQILLLVCKILRRKTKELTKFLKNLVLKYNKTSFK